MDRRSAFLRAIVTCGIKIPEHRLRRYRKPYFHPGEVVYCIVDNKAIQVNNGPAFVRLVDRLGKISPTYRWVVRKRVSSFNDRSPR